MNVAIVGSRSVTKYETVKAAIMKAPWINDVPLSSFKGNIVSGGADGVDSMAERFAESHDIETEIYEPQWDDWGNGHPAIARNATIVENSDAVIAVWDGNSNGTRDTIDKALDSGTPIYVEIP